MKPQNLELLARLPLLLNSSLDVREVIRVALNCTRNALSSEAATVFIKEDDSSEITIWALQGGAEEKLEGKKMPAGKGIVGWVIENNEPVLVPDVHKDARFFPAIEREGGFVTRDLICAPLYARGDAVFGAVQVLNKIGGPFDSEDLAFLEQLSHQVALAINNARLFESLQTRTKLLENLDRKKDDMISVIVHEFQTPLNVVLTSADLIASGVIKDPATFKRMTDTLLQGASRLSRVISEVKNVSLVSGGKLAPKYETFDVRNVISILAEHFAVPIQSRKQTLTLKLCESPALISGDESLIFIAVRNLIANAIRFTPDGGSLTIDVQPSTGMIEVSVSDTGIGIEPGQLGAIFEKFYEVTSALYHSSGQYEFKSCGLGLGLAAVKAITLSHNATINVESVTGKGSTFTMRLPAAT